MLAAPGVDHRALASVPVLANVLPFKSGGCSSAGRHYYSSSSYTLLGRGTVASQHDDARKAAPTAPPVAVVKVGRGRDFQFPHKELLGMDWGAFLIALSRDEFFRDAMRGVRLDHCTVKVVNSAGKAPTAEEEASGVEMGPFDTLGKVAGDCPWFFVRVKLPEEKVPEKKKRARVTKRSDDAGDATQLLASIRKGVPGEYLRTGDALLRQSRSVTANIPQLSGVRLGDLLSGSLNTAPLPEHLIPHLKETRGVTLSSIATGFAERKRLRSTSSAGTSAIPGEEGRSSTPLVAVQSSPGGGKSSLLDYAALLSIRGLWTEDFCADEGMRTILNASVPVAVTHNSGTDVNFNRWDASLETGLALRILRTFFAPGMNFSEFVHTLRPSSKGLSPADAIECCLKALEEVDGRPKRRILLLVDEITKLDEYRSGRGKSAAKELLSIIGQLLDRFPSEQLNVICTTLDAKPFLDLQKASQRPIWWAPLPALTQHQAESMMCDALGVKTLPRAVREAASDCNGHPRSLEYVLVEAMEVRAINPEIWKDDAALLARLRKKAAARAAWEPPHWALHAALTSQALPLEKPLIGDSERFTLRQHIARGTFLDSDVHNQEDFLPRLSLLRLLCTYKGSLEGYYARQLAGAHSFGLFVMHWLRIRLRTAAQSNSPFTVTDLLLGPVQREGCSSANHLDPKVMRASLKLRERERISVRERATETLSDVLTNDKWPLMDNDVYVFGADNPGFDSLVMVQPEDKQPKVLLAFESRFASARASDAAPLQSPTDEGPFNSEAAVEDTARAWGQQRELLAEKCGVAPDRCVLVYFAAQQRVTLNDQVRRTLEKENIVVLGRRAAMAVFSPTLAQRAAMILDGDFDAPS